MSGVLTQLTTSPPAGNVNSGAATQTSYPDWYNQFIQGLTSRGVQTASQPYAQYQGARVAGFSPDQTQAFGNVRSNVGSWQPALTQAQGALSQINQNQSWADPATRASYMNPYTAGVTDEIARLGNRNFTENLMPQVNDAFTGGGQFGSTRNAEILGRTARDVQADITGAQANALRSGYSDSAGIFNTDATRNANTGIATAGALGTVAQQQQRLQSGDTSALLGIGGAQQAQQQQGMDLAYGDFNAANNYDATQLNWLRGMLSGVNVPTGTTSATSRPDGPTGASPLQWIQALLNQNAGNAQPAA